MTLARREVMLAGLGAGLTVAASPRLAEARDAQMPEAFSTYGIAPA